MICETLTDHDIWRKPSLIIVLLFDHQVCLHILITFWQHWVQAFCQFSPENVVPIAHEQNIICSKTSLDGTTHEQTIICRQLFAGHVVGSRLKERKTKMHPMIIGNTDSNACCVSHIACTYTCVSFRANGAINRCIRDCFPFLLGCRRQSQSRNGGHLFGVIFFFFRVGKSLACHSPFKWYLCA